MASQICSKIYEDDPLGTNDVRTSLPVIEKPNFQNPCVNTLYHGRKGPRKVYVPPPGLSEVSALRFDIGGNSKASVSSSKLSRSSSSRRQISDDETVSSAPARAERYARLHQADDRTGKKKKKGQDIVIWKGRRLHTTTEFINFQRRCAVRWKRIDKVLGLLEDMCLKHAIPMATADSDIIDALAQCEFSTLKLADLYKCVKSMETLSDHPESSAVIKIREEASRQIEDAAIRIQTMVRKVIALARISTRREYTCAAICLQATCRRTIARDHTQRLLAKRRSEQEQQWIRLTRKLKEDMDPTAKHHGRLEIHLPSLGFFEETRLLHSDDFATTQALQIARLCESVEQDVHVVYVSPLALSDELIQYYRQMLLTLRNDNGQQQEKVPKFTVVWPELATRLPSHTTLSSALLYSSSCLKRLRKLARTHSFAYIIPAGPIGWADRALALELNVPLLATEPAQATLLASRSGARDLFQKAHLNLPLGASELYEEADIANTLTNLILNNLEASRWIFSIDADAAMSGTAYLDVDGLDTLISLRRDKNKAGPTKWALADVQRTARARIFAMLRASFNSAAPRVVVCSPEGGTPSATLHQSRTWEHFMAAMQRFGGIIQAEPQNKIAQIAAHFLLRPDGQVDVYGIQEILLDAHYRRVAAVYPQHSVPEQAILAAVHAIARELHVEHKALGYYSLHLLAFENKGLRLCATELEQGLTPFSIGHRLHQQALNRPQTDDAYCLLPQVRHAGLASCTLSAFFRLCRTHGISYDAQRNRGPLFVLVDSLAAGVIGSLIRGNSRLDAISSALRTLAFFKKVLTTAHIIFDGTSSQPGPQDAECLQTCLYTLADKELPSQEDREAFRGAIQIQNCASRPQKRSSSSSTTPF